MRSFDIGMFRWLERGRRSYGVLLMGALQTFTTGWFSEACQPGLVFTKLVLPSEKYFALCVLGKYPNMVDVSHKICSGECSPSNH